MPTLPSSGQEASTEGGFLAIPQPYLGCSLKVLKNVTTLAKDESRLFSPAAVNCWSKFPVESVTSALKVPVRFIFSSVLWPEMKAGAPLSPAAYS